MNVFREATPGTSALEEYLQAKRREFVGAAGEEIGASDATRLGDDLARLSHRAEIQLVEREKSGVCYLVMGKVQSGKTGSQLGMLAWAADRCDVAVIFTGVTEALNGQTTDRISSDLSGLPSSPVIAMPVPTRGQAERNASFLESVLRRTQQRRDWREGEGMWPERLPVLVSMKTKPRVDALKWLFGEVAAQLGEGVTALIIDDEADQASPNAATRKGEEAATYSELKALRDASKHHVWLSYTATPQAIFLTELDGALRPDYCAVSRPGTGYFGVAELMDPAQRLGRVTVADWPTVNRSGTHPPSSLKRAVCDVLCAGWLRARHPEAFYRRGEVSAAEGMRSVQMLVHTNSRTQEHVLDYESVQSILATLRQELEEAIRSDDLSRVPSQLTQAWEAMTGRVLAATGSTVRLPELMLEQLYQVGGLIGQVEVRVVNSDKGRPTAEAGLLPIKRAAWEAHPIWIVIGGDILGRGLTFPQLVTTYFTRIAQSSSEDTVSQQMRFCGYRSTYSHLVTVHALQDIFDLFSYLAQVERALMATAEDWDEQDKDLRLDEPALWYVARPTNRMRPTRLAVRTRELFDEPRQRVVLSLRQFLQPRSFQRNARALVDWLESGNVARELLEDWQLVECGVEEVRELLGSLLLSGTDDADRDVALELMSARLRDLGLANLPFAVIFRGLDCLRVAASGRLPELGGLPVRRLQQSPPPDGFSLWESAWTNASLLRPHEWFDDARLGVPHVGDAQRRPIGALGYDAVTVLIEPMSVHGGDEAVRVAGGVAMTIQTPEGFELQDDRCKAVVNTVSYEQVAQAVDDVHVPGHANDVKLALLDRTARIGIGRAGSGAFVFVGPQQPAVAAMFGTRFEFKPATDLRPVGSDARLDDVCILRFTPADPWDGLKAAVAAVFTGLASTGRVSPLDLGPAIHALRALFEADLRSQVAREVEIGLAGELLAISGAADREAMAERWHSAVDDTYDFSTNGERLEIKTTTGVERLHWVTSGQVAGIPGVCTSFLSVLLPVVAHGVTTKDLFEALGDLPPLVVARIRSLIIDTAGEPPELLINLQFDLTAARAGLRHIPAACVPAPVPTPGVRRMRWEAEFPDIATPSPACSFAAILGL